MSSARAYARVPAEEKTSPDRKSSADVSSPPGPQVCGDGGTSRYLTPELHRILAELGPGESLSAPGGFPTGLTGQARIHRDATAARWTSQYQARAMTLGRHILFSPGAYQPASLPGAVILAHELAHVAQQGRDPVAAPSDSVLEAAADSAAASMLLGGSPPLHPPAGGLRLQRCAQDAETTSANLGQGATTFGLGALGAGIGIVILLSGPVGWIGGLVAAMAIGSGVAGMGMGAAHMATAGTRTREQDRRLAQAESVTMTLGSGPLATVGGTIGTVIEGERGLQVGATAGALTEGGIAIIHGGALAVVRMRRFNAAARELNITDFRWGGPQGDLLREANRRAFGIGEVTPIANPAFARGEEVLEFSHMIPRRWMEARGLARLGSSPLNLRPTMSLEHALVDPWRFNFVRRGFKPGFDNPYSPWISPRARVSPYTWATHPNSPIATARSLPRWLAGEQIRYVGPVQWVRLASDPVQSLLLGTGRGTLGAAHSAILFRVPADAQGPGLLPLAAGRGTGFTPVTPVPGTSPSGGAASTMTVRLQIPRGGSGVAGQVIYLPAGTVLQAGEELLIVPIGDLPQQDTTAFLSRGE